MTPSTTPLSPTKFPLYQELGDGKGGAADSDNSTYSAHMKDARFTIPVEQGFLVCKSEIAENGYDLSINRYREIVYEEVKYDPPEKILGELRVLETEIMQGINELEAMLRRD